MRLLWKRANEVERSPERDHATVADKIRAAHTGTSMPETTQTQAADKMQPNTSRALLGGAVGTAAIIAVMYLVGPLVSGGPMNVAAVIGVLAGTNAVAGILILFVLGTLAFPLLFRFALAPLTPGPTWVKGALWGTILWLATEMVLVPIANGGFFHAASGGAGAVVASLIGHLSYGLLLGLIAGIDEPESPYDTSGSAAKTCRMI